MDIKINRRSFLSRWSSLALLVPFVPELVQIVKAKAAVKGPMDDPHQSSHPMGYGRCSKCACGQYQQADTAGNDYCTCGHSYADHWNS